MNKISFRLQQEIFRDELDRELDEFADEASVVQKLRSEAKRAARIEKAVIGPDTVILKRGAEEDELADDLGEETVERDIERPVDETIDERISSGRDFDQGAEEEETDYDADTFTGSLTTDKQKREPILVGDAEVLEIGDGEVVEEYDDEDEEALETYKMDRPDPAIFEKQVERKIKKRRARKKGKHPPIREVGGPGTATLDTLDTASASGKIVIGEDGDDTGRSLTTTQFAASYGSPMHQIIARRGSDEE